MLCLSCPVKKSLNSYINSTCRILVLRHNATTQSQTHYQTLGVQNEASSKEIRSAYLELCKKHHPDANPSDPQAQKKFVQLQEAYNVLSSPKERAQYDMKISSNNRMKQGTQYTRSTGSPYSDEFMRQYYQAQARARQRRPEEEFYDGVKWSKEQQRMHEEQIDEMLRNEKERRQAYEKIFQEYNKNEKERRQAYEKVFREYYKNASREHMQGNPFGDGRARFYYDYHYPNQYSLPARMIIFLWAFLFFMMMVSNPSR
ncbi:uncharacterized protein LOC111127835 [Crassostrea virginica]